MVVWVQNGCKGIRCLPLWSCGWRGAAMVATAQHHERVSDRISLAQEKIKFEVGFLLNAYRFCNILKLNHCKSGIICNEDDDSKSMLVTGCWSCSGHWARQLTYDGSFWPHNCPSMESLWHCVFNHTLWSQIDPCSSLCSATYSPVTWGKLQNFSDFQFLDL